MKITFFSSKAYDQENFSPLAANMGVELVFQEAKLTEDTVALAKGSQAVCVFVNDTVNAAVVAALANLNIRCIALRCAGFNNVDLEAAEQAQIAVVRVPEYSPYAVAEHAVALILTLNRKIHRAWNRVREGNFALDGLVGFDLNGCTVGVVGTGKIGRVFVGIMRGFGCKVIAHDPFPNPELEAEGIPYLPLWEMLPQVDILSLHCPLTPETHHLIDKQSMDRIKRGSMLINTSRGALIDTRALIDALKSGAIGSVGLDVYEEEGDLFFENLSDQIISDDVFMRLTTFPNVLITGHQAFLTRNALDNIASVTLQNLLDVEAGRPCANAVHSARFHASH